MATSYGDIKRIEASRGELDALGLAEIDIRLGQH
jgi:hypothetical protein